MTQNYALGDPCVQLWTFGMFCLSLQTGQSADEDLFFTRSGWLWNTSK